MKPDEIRRLDPRAKLLFLGTVGIQPFLADSWYVAGFSLLLILGIILACGISVRIMVIHLRRILWFLIFILLVNVVTGDGHVLFQIDGFYGTGEGLATGLRLCSNLVILLWTSFLLLQTTPPEDIVDALRVWIVPFHRIPGTLVLLITLTVNLVPVLADHVRVLGYSFKARGFDTGSTPGMRIRFLTAATPRLFSSALRIIPQLANAMEARCYNPSQPRTMYRSLRFTRLDWILVGSGCMMITSSVFLIG